MRKHNLTNADRTTIRLHDELCNAERQREAYRANCTMRRRGNRIERLEEGRWILDQESKSINAAKRKSREVSALANLYAV